MSRTSAHKPFRKIMALIATETPLTCVLNAIVQSAEEEANGVLCSILLLDETRQVLKHGAAPNLPAAFNEAVERSEIRLGVGVCGAAVLHRDRAIVQDIQTDPLCAPFRDIAETAGLRSCWSQPIRGAGGEILGAFALYHRTVCAPTTEDIDFIEAMAELSAITIAHHRAKEALAESEARARKAAVTERETARDLRTFFEVSLDMLCIRDMDRKFIKVNQAWEQVLGYSVDELEGAPMLPLIHPEDAGDTTGHMDRMRSEFEVIGFVNRYRHRDGHYRHLEWRARRVGDLVFGVARDVTERLAFEAEIGAAKLAAEAANQAKSDFLANMSHEIRTPLNGVIGVVDALARTPLTIAQREMVDLIERSGVTLERLVSDILDVSKIEAGRLEIEQRVFDLRDELESLVEMHRVRAHEKGLSFHTEFSTSARGQFHGDSTRIKQILGNLLSNAVKFTPAGEIRLAIDVVDGQVEAHRATIIFQVSDTGVGFDAAAGSNLFQRFSQADTTITRRFGGTGLGLSICRDLAAMMGGDISVQSAPGRGSHFRVVIPLPRHLPLDAYDAALAACGCETTGACAEPATMSEAPLRILLAEDHPTNQRVVQLILEPYGAEITIAENGAEAVEALGAADFDLVLMDMQMPIMDGLAATRAIRRRQQTQGGARTPIIMLSANAMSQHRQDAMDAGADLHLAKPVTAATLIAGISEALDMQAARSAKMADELQG
ncbi:MAG: ATP-binding protein [Caulobacteraceae bacterium]|nr:ATP-binding protein [Caulobacteraceae bacterium]